MFASACGPSPYKSLAGLPGNATALKPLRPVFSTVLYRAEIDVVGKHLSGLLFFKTLPDSTIRTVFTNEMGLNFFDFEFSKTGFQVKHIMEKLNRKAVIRQLGKDLGFLIMHGVDFENGTVLKSPTERSERYFAFPMGKETTYYVTDSATTKLLRIENASRRKKKVIVSLTGPKRGLPDSSFIDHKLFRFTISLKQITR